MKYIIAIAIASVVLALVINEGLKSHEANECIKWLGESRQYKEYFVTDWQISQCGRHDIFFPDTVKVIHLAK